ncbi:unnamed protein product, partial [Rhizophagus irregularis]
TVEIFFDIRAENILITLNETAKLTNFKLFNSQLIGAICLPNLKRFKQLEIEAVHHDPDLGQKSRKYLKSLIIVSRNIHKLHQALVAQT